MPGTSWPKIMLTGKNVRLNLKLSKNRGELTNYEHFSHRRCRVYRLTYLSAGAHDINWKFNGRTWVGMGWGTFTERRIYSKINIRRLINRKNVERI